MTPKEALIAQVAHLRGLNADLASRAAKEIEAERAAVKRCREHAEESRQKVQDERDKADELRGEIRKLEAIAQFRAATFLRLLAAVEDDYVKTKAS